MNELFDKICFTFFPDEPFSGISGVIVENPPQSPILPDPIAQNLVDCNPVVQNPSTENLTDPICQNPIEPNSVEQNPMINDSFHAIGSKYRPILPKSI